MITLKNKYAEWPELYPKVERTEGSIKKGEVVTVGGFELRKGVDYIPQRGLQEFMFTSEADIILLGGQPGGGKCQIISDLVLKKSGFVTIGSINVGDYVLGRDGSEKRVLGVYDVGVKDIYEIEMIDGGKARCTDNHLWAVRTSSSQTKPHRKSKECDRIEKSWRIKEFSEIRKFLDEKKDGHHKGHNLLIPLCEKMPFDNGFKPLVDPYIIGIFLGDGCMSRKDGTLSYSTKDEYLVDCIRESGISIRHKGKFDYYISECNSLRSEFRRVGLIGSKSDTKFIPSEYKNASIEVRTSILQGLLDTDGTVDSRGHVSFCSTSHQLALDVQFIVRSIGGKATIREKTPFYKSKDGEKIYGKISYEVYIKTKNDVELFRLDRKKNRCKNGFNGGYSPLCNRIIGYRYYGKEKARCIYIEGDEHLYVTNDFIVTHNTLGLLLKALDGIHVRGYGCLIVKKQLVSTKSGAGGIIDDAKRVFDFGGSEFTSSDNPTFTWPTWGTSVTFTHANFSAETEKGLFDAQEKLKNFQNAAVFVDECTDHDWKVINYLLSRNRDSSGVPSKFIMTFNTNSHHFTRRIIDWWIGEDGRVIPERIGKIRYAKIGGDSVKDIIWGDTKQEVVEKAGIIVPDDLKAKGMVAEDLVKSVTFRPCKISENMVLLSATKGGHAANIFNLGETETKKLFDEDWNAESEGTATVSRQMVRDIWINPYQEGGVMYASLDVAGGGDNCVMIIWKEMTIVAIENFDGDSKELELWIKSTLNNYKVPIRNMSFDATGIGSYLKGYTDGRAVTANMRPIQEYDDAGNPVTMELYFNVRSQLMAKAQYMFETGQISCVVDKNKLYPHGKKKIPKELVEILIEESDEFRRTTKGNRFYFKSKDEFKDRFGYSPDYMDAIIYRMIFTLDGKERKEVEMELTEADYAGLYGAW